MTPPPVTAPGAATPAPPPATTGAPTPTTPTTTSAPPPSGAPVLTRVLGRALTQEEAVAIALETQPSILARLLDYSAAAFRVAQRLIRVQEQAVERANLNLRSARGFFEVGTRPKSDVARAEVDVANARVDLIRARNAERLARVALNTAMGIPAETPTQVQDNLVYQPITMDHAQLYARP